MTKEILLEGFTADEILALPAEEIEKLILTDEPLVFTAGSAQILGKVRIQDKRLIVELAHIEGGGEGVMRTLWLLAERYARNQSLKEMEWIVHALNCAKPNPKLRPFLERRGFTVRDIPGTGQAYWYLHNI